MKASNSVISGTYLGATYGAFTDHLTWNDKMIYLNRSNVKGYELLESFNDGKTTGNVVGRAVAGAVIAGRVGAVIGAATSNDQESFRVKVYWLNGSASIIEMDRKRYNYIAQNNNRYSEPTYNRFSTISTSQLKPVQEASNKSKININPNATPDSLKKRALMFTEDEDFDASDEYCNYLLDLDPTDAEVYKIKFLNEYRCTSFEDMISTEGMWEEDFNESQNYQKILKFGSEDLINEVKSCIAQINENGRKDKEEREKREQEEAYSLAISRFTNAKTKKDYLSLVNDFWRLGDYKDSEEMFNKCKDLSVQAVKEEMYAEAISYAEKKDIEAYKKAIEMLESLGEYRNSFDLIKTYSAKIEEIKTANEAIEKKKKNTVKIACVAAAVLLLLACVAGFVHANKSSKNYNQAMTYFENNDYEAAQAMFEDLGTYKDAASMVAQCKDRITQNREIEDFRNNNYWKNHCEEFPQLNEKEISDLFQGKFIVDSIEHQFTKVDDHTINDKHQSDLLGYRDFDVEIVNDTIHWSIRYFKVYKITDDKYIMFAKEGEHCWLLQKK